MGNNTIESKLLKMGKQWHRAGATRFYFNDLCRAYGLVFETKESGKIIRVLLDGDEIEVKKGLLLKGKLAIAKVWFDTAKGTFHHSNLDWLMAQEVIEFIRKEISEFITPDEDVEIDYLEIIKGKDLLIEAMGQANASLERTVLEL